MTDPKRRAVAYVAGRLKNRNPIARESKVGTQVSMVYDQNGSPVTNHRYAGRVSFQYVKVFDYDRDAYLVEAEASGGHLRLFDHASSSNIELDWTLNQFNGFDHETSTHFSGRIQNRSVLIYDNEHDASYRYSF